MRAKVIYSSTQRANVTSHPRQIHTYSNSTFGAKIDLVADATPNDASLKEVADNPKIRFLLLPKRHVAAA